MLTPILEEIEQRLKLNKSRRDQQRFFTTLEIGFLWDTLKARYQTLDTTRVFLGAVQDTDLKFILQQGEKFLSKEIERLEKVSVEIGISTTEKPPENPLSIFDTELFTDKYIYQHTLGGMQSFLPLLVIAFSHAISPMIRTLFQEFLTAELKLYSDFLDYGLLKSWVSTPPAYRI